MSVHDDRLRFVALNGSLRRDGTTAAVLRLVAGHLGGRDVGVEVVHLADRRVVACRCGRCNSRADPCPVDDDVPEVVRAMARADALIYAVPVHGYGAASLMQLFIERAGVGQLRFRRPLANKVGGAIVVGRRYAHESVHSQMVSNMLLNQLVVPGSGFPAVVRAGGPDVVGEDREGVRSVLALADRMRELAELLRAHPLPDHRGVERRVGVLS